MATILQFIAQCLDRQGWKYEIEAANFRIITSVQAQNGEDLWIVLQLLEGGKFLQFCAPQILHVKDHVYKGVLFQTMLAISWEVKMLRFEYDPTDGEVRASIELPLEDAELTYQQFDRCLSNLSNLVEHVAMPRLKAVLATGQDPGQTLLAESWLDTLPEELLNLLEQAMAARQQRRNI
ncbi:YbjN domain-containing protein [Chroococcidiopsis sp. CCMEE 29]|uniref:YbjN domain-containing protein n=1 Tax=Chroococcidiopsis sp. CCMEE 29 TaxID=155894 RepID=UPI0020220173|nr:YbjN domain-containing protein [Chroococcidiopsis sp. CCMEE 29]